MVGCHWLVFEMLLGDLVGSAVIPGKLIAGGLQPARFLILQN